MHLSWFRWWWNYGCVAVVVWLWWCGCGDVAVVVWLWWCGIDRKFADNISSVQIFTFSLLFLVFDQSDYFIE